MKAYFFKYFIYNSLTKRLKSSFLFPLITVIVGSFVIMFSFSIMEGFSSEIKNTINFIDRDFSLKVNKKIFLERNPFKIDQLVEYLKSKNNFYNAYEQRFMFVNNNNNKISCKVYGIRDYNILDFERFLINHNNNFFDVDKNSFCFVGYNQSISIDLRHESLIKLNSILDFENLNSYPKKDYYVKGILKTNIPQYDNSIFINYDSLLFSKNIFLKINLNRSLKKDDIIELNEKFGNGINYNENNSEFFDLFYAINFEKMFYGFIGICIIVISSLMMLGFNIVNITQNITSIATLKVLGLNNRMIVLLYLFYSNLISLLGFFISSLCFFIVIYFDRNYDIMNFIFDPNVYFNFNLNLDYKVLFNIFLLDIILITTSSFYPLYKINKLDIIDSLRNRV